MAQKQNFHKQLLKQNDPLAIIFKAMRESEKNPPKMRVDYSSFNDYEEDERVNPLIIVFIISIAALLGFVFWKLLL